MAKSPWTIHEVKTDIELEELGRFRYRVYIEQTGKSAPYVNHEQKTMIEPLDATSTNLIARDVNGVLCGAVRISLANNGWALPEVLNPVPWHWVAPEQIAHVSRLMVEKTKKGLSITSRLFNECYSWGLDHDVQFCTVFCSPLLKSLFEKYAYVAFDEVFLDEHVGDQVPMVLYMNDVHYFEAVGSPFYHLLSARRKRDIKPDPKCIELMDRILSKNELQ